MSLLPDINRPYFSKKRTINIAFFVFFVFLPLIIRDDYYRYLLVITAINAILVIGLDLTLGYAGRINLAQAGFWGIGAYASAVASLNWGLPFWGGVIFAMVLSAMIAFFVGYPSLKLAGHYFVIITFVFGIILTILFNNLLSITRGPMGLPGIPPVTIWHYKIIDRVSYYYLTLSFIVLIMLFKYKLVNSRFGRALIAIREGEALAEAIGINTHKYKIFAFTISATIAGIAGALYAHFLSYIGPSSFTFEQSMELFTMNLIGGAGTMAGPIIGTAMLTVFSEVARSFSPALARVAFGLFLVLAIIFTPKGIMGLIEKVKNR